MPHVHGQNMKGMRGRTAYMLWKGSITYYVEEEAAGIGQWVVSINVDELLTWKEGW